MPVLLDIGSMIESTPRVLGGRPRIAGTRTSVQCIATESQTGNSPEEIVAERPHLTLAQVHAALAYYWPTRRSLTRISPRNGRSMTR
jgi:uncharacterized protein (DUF433 family)